MGRKPNPESADRRQRRLGSRVGICRRANNGRQWPQEGDGWMDWMDCNCGEEGRWVSFPCVFLVVRLRLLDLDLLSAAEKSFFHLLLTTTTFFDGTAVALLLWLLTSESSASPTTTSTFYAQMRPTIINPPFLPQPQLPDEWRNEEIEISAEYGHGK